MYTMKKSILLAALALLPSTILGQECFELVSLQGDMESPLCTNILASNDHIVAGHLCVELATNDAADADDDELIFTWTTIDGWRLDEVHLELGIVAYTPEDSTSPGQFTFKEEELDSTTTEVQLNVNTTFISELTDPDSGESFNCDSRDIYFLAHVSVKKYDDETGEVIQAETGWSNGTEVNDGTGGNWAMYSKLDVECCSDDGTEQPTDESTNLECETAYAGGEEPLSGCFDEVEDLVLPERWGWVLGPFNPFNPSDEAKSYVFPIYAAAGQCEIDKGIQVGDLYVHIDENITIVYVMDEGYAMNETHVHVGEEKLPKNKNGNFTVANGQFKYKEEGLFNSDPDESEYYEIVITDWTGGDFYIVAHAEVCGESFDKPSEDEAQEDEPDDE